MMQQQGKRNLKNHIRFLTENVCKDTIPALCDCLIRDSVFTQSDIERVNNEITTEQKVRKIVKILFYKDERAIPFFKKALHETRQQFIVDELEKPIPCEPTEIDYDLRQFIMHALSDKFEEQTGGCVSLEEIWKELLETARYMGRTSEFDDVDNNVIVEIVKSVFPSCKVEHQSPRGKHRNFRANTNFSGIWPRSESERDVCKMDASRQESCDDEDSGATGDCIVTRDDSKLLCDDKGCSVVETMNKDELYKWLIEVLQRLQLPSNVAEKFRENEIDGKVFVHLTLEELKEIIPLLGPRKKLIMERDRAIGITSLQSEPVSVPKKEVCNRMVESLRPFDQEIRISDKYRKGSVIHIEQSRIKNLIDPVHRFILPDKAENESKEVIEFILKETIKFGAACINERTNGTVHFGIAGSTENLCGEIVGIHLDKESCQKRLTDAIRIYFFPEQQSKALSCIRPAKFIEVTTGLLQSNVLYVVEVDVKPSYKTTNDEAFFIQMSDGNDKDPCSLYRYTENGPTLQNHREIAQYMKECPTLSEHRRDAEDRLFKRVDRTNRFKKLSDFLCCGSERIESDIYPLLFINSPDASMETTSIQKTFSFLKDIQWRAIFDFAPDRNNGILYKFVNDDLNRVFQTKCLEDFDADKVEKKQLKETLDGLKESSLPSWVFCSSEMDGHNDVTSWKLKCSKSFREVLKFYQESIPKERTRVLFLLLSKHYDIMQEAAIEVMIDFQDQSLIMADSELCACQWKDSLLRGHCIEKRKLEDCCLIGLPWAQVNQSIQKMSDARYTDDIEIPRSNGVPCILPERIMRELSDLEILGMNDCKQRVDSLLETEREELKRTVGENFYTGEQATWLNYYYSDQVLKRQKSEELRSMITTALISSIQDPEECVGSVAIYHQPGAGGTTLGKHMLWDFRQEYRCCIARNITTQTGDQLLRLFEYEDDGPKPLLVFIDNGDDERIFPLYEDLQKRKRSDNEMFCVLLVCYRKTQLPSNKIAKNIMLFQKLSEEEVNWFKDKNQDLLAQYRQKKGCNPNQLLSFNIMKENYSKECIEHSVSEFVRDMISRGNEGLLLKYTAFANTFDLDFQAIPAACFDPIMSRKPRNGWECRLSQSARVLLSKDTNRGIGGKIPSFRVSNALLSRYILDAVLELEIDKTGKQQTIGEVALEFSHSAMFKTEYRPSRQRDMLIKVLLNVVNKRAWNDEKRDQFSPLIVELLSEKDTDSALSVLVTAYELTDNHIVAQQIARFYESIQNFEQANCFIDEAIQKSDRTRENSYLWHTKGQICRSMLSQIKEKQKREHNLNISDANLAIEHSKKAIRFFRTVQELSRKEKTSTQNLAGYDGEVQITLQLLDLLCSSSLFSGPDAFRRSLVDGNVNPGLTIENVQFLQSLQTSVYETLDALESYILLVQKRPFCNQNKLLAIQNASLLEHYKTNLNYWFPAHLVDNPRNNCSFLQNRRFAKGMGATSFLGVLKLRDNFDAMMNVYQAIKRNLDNGSRYAEDYRIAIAIIIALPDHNRDEGMLAKALELSRSHYDTREKLKRPLLVLEACLYITLLHWPSENQTMPNVCPQSVLKNAINVWNETVNAQGDNRRRDKILFYLCNGNGGHFFIYEECLRNVRSPMDRKQTIFRTPLALHRLARLEGLLKNNGEAVEIKLCRPGENAGPTIQVPVLCPVKRQTAWNRKVNFVLGFGLYGLKAIDLSETKIIPRQVPSNVSEGRIVGRGRTRNDGILNSQNPNSTSFRFQTQMNPGSLANTNRFQPLYDLSTDGPTGFAERPSFPIRYPPQSHVQPILYQSSAPQMTIAMTRPSCQFENFYK